MLRYVVVFLYLLVHAQLAGAQFGGATRILVGYPPGQATDAIARLVADRLAAQLRETVIVENKPGQAGSIAAAMLVKAPADGKTMLVTPMGALNITPHLYSRVGYNTLADIQGVSMICEVPLVLIARKGIKVKSVTELVTYARLNPGKLTHYSSGSGTLSHLGLEELKRRADIRMLHVPYKGSAPALTDLLGGNVDIGLETVTAAQPLLRSGKVELLAVGTSKRLAAYPDTPTIEEQGYRGILLAPWVGVVYPKGTPKEFIDRTSGMIERMVEAKDVQERLNSMGLIPRYVGAEEFQEYIASEYARWGTVVKESGVKVE